MSEGFATQLPSPKGNGQIRLWLKSADYAKRLLLGEAGDPWVSAAHYLAYFSQAHALVKPDVAVLEVGDLYDSWAATHADWSESVNKRRRPATALRRLIEPEAPRQVLAEVVEAVMRAVLRAGAYELKKRKDIPARVVITEYVDVAAAFLARDEVGMTNAVLDALARKLRAADFQD